MESEDTRPALVRPLLGRVRPGERCVRGVGNAFDVHPRAHIDASVSVSIEGDDNEVVVGVSADLQGKSWIVVEGSRNRIRIGAAVAGHLRILVATDDAEVVIGDGTTAVGAAFRIHEPSRLIVGRDCMLSAGIQIWTSDVHPIVDLDTGERCNPAADVRIGDHVWLCGDVMVLKGTTIGSGSVVGARSLVTGSIPENCVAAGSPARVLREAATWERWTHREALRSTAVLRVGVS